eukprot:Selendium_serpulae@DN6358_c0_g1_i4.p1
MTKIKMRSAQVMILTFAVLSVVSSGDPRPPGHSTYPSCPPPDPIKPILLGVAPPITGDCCLTRDFQNTIIRDVVLLPTCPKPGQRNAGLCEALNNAGPPLIRPAARLVPTGTSFPVQRKTRIQPDPEHPNFELAEVVGEVEQSQSVVLMSSPHGCYNIAPPGTTHVPLFCKNHLLGDKPYRTFSDLIFHKSIVTAGNVAMNGNHFELGVLVGGDLSNAPTSRNAAICFQCDLGYEGIEPFHDATVWVGGAVNPGRQATVNEKFGQFDALGGALAVTVETDADFFINEASVTS